VNIVILTAHYRSEEFLLGARQEHAFSVCGSTGEAGSLRDTGDAASLHGAAISQHGAIPCLNCITMAGEGGVSIWPQKEALAPVEFAISGASLDGFARHFEEFTFDVNARFGLAEQAVDVVAWRAEKGVFGMGVRGEYE
jgi:hypothetical protein